MRYITLILLICLSTSVYSKDDPTAPKKAYITLSGDLFAIGNKDITVSNYNLDFRNPYYLKFSIGYVIRNDLIVGWYIKNLQYHFLYSKSSLQANNPDFYILKADEAMDYNAVNFGLSIAKRFSINKFDFFPNISIGYRNLNTTKWDAVLKQNNSNTIRSIINSSKLTDGKIAFSVGTDINWNITKSFGLALTLDYDYFNPKLHSQFNIKDYYNETTLTGDYKIKRHIIQVAVGIIISV